MLVSRPTKYGAGITLGGDYLDFVNLHETIHAMAGESGPLSGHQQEYLLGLAYDLRKAKEGKRDSWTSDAGAYENYKAVNVLWPVFLVQIALLRAACTYVPTDRRTQAHIYLLEACAQEALSQYDAAVASICMRWLATFSLPPDTFLLDFVTHQTRDFLFGASPGKTRFRRLPRLLDDISPYSSSYQTYERDISQEARDRGVKPQDLVDLSQWPPFKW